MFTTPTGHNNFDDGSDLELGFKFQADVDGYIAGIRFYKQGLMSGTHVGRLWTSGGSPMASKTFTSETASGWQEVTFDAPVSVTAGTTYVASVSMPDGRYIATLNYFTTEQTNFPLRAPSSGTSGGNGVFNTNAGSFPTTSSNSANYWVDVSYRANLGSDAPTVDSTDPVDDATGVVLGKTLRATFDQALDPTTLTASTFTVKDSSNNPVPGSVAYSNSTKVASFVPNEGFTTGQSYTATLEGGSGTVVENMEGVALASDYSWTFTAATTDPCPCSLKDEVNPSGASAFDETTSVELGSKMKADTNGYITAIRFYKPITSTESSHTVNIWSSTGSSLGSATTSNETSYGWQEAKLGTPVRVTEGQLFIVSYGAGDGIYVSQAGGHNSNITNGHLTAYADTSSENAATGSGNRNGVFRSTAGLYPNVGSTTGNYYWVDAVFSTSSAPTDPLEVKVVQPSADSYGVQRNKPVKATFNRALNAGTVSNSTVRLFDASNNQVSGTASYETSSHSVIFTPSSQLTYNQRYTVRLSASIEDTGGITLGSEYSWNFTVGSALSTDPNDGPGGPVLLITASANKYSPYYAEILRTEGLNHFDVKDISNVSASVLDDYDAVVVAEMSLTQGQADMFTDWVTSDGGNVIAMRPDKKLASLLGITDASSTRTNQYLLVDTASGPGAGIVNETIQYKGTADNYTVDTATAVATFYSNASTSTANPAVTTRSVGSNGGTAAAFTYDLAKSVIALHQGNQAWAGDNRDGVSPIRSNDMFFGAKSGDVQPDWVDLNKIHIPQADEQQRLLANMLIDATKDKKPLPRFWYLPYSHKAAMVMVGDDHGLSNAVGTEKVFNNWLSESPTWCELDKWECVRASDYNYASSSLTQSRALQFYNLGFDIGDHPESACANFASYAALSTIYTNSLTNWRSKYTGLPNQRGNRFHCYTWSDWDSMMRVDNDNGMRYDLNYVALPASWIGTRAPLLTGSGMNMRFTDADGDMVDVYQGVTNFENTVNGAAAIDTVLDNAVGSTGYYGIFGTHYDMSGDNYEATLLAQAKAHNIPIISSDQVLTWLDGRNSSTFSNFDGGAGQFTFDLEAGMGAQGLKAMMPIEDAAGTLTSLMLGSDTVAYQTQTVKGIQYAVFDAEPGSYTATYSDYDPSSGGSSGNGNGGSGSSGGSGGTTDKKTTSKPGNSVFAPDVPIPDATVQDPEQTEQKTDPSDEDKERNIETAPAEERNWSAWLVGVALVAFIAGTFVAVARRRHKGGVV